MSEKMIVGCPECQTRFVAPLEKFLPSGRKVRCAKCGHAWFQEVEAKSPPAEPEAVETTVEAPAKTETASTPTESLMDRAAKVASVKAEEAGLVETTENSLANIDKSVEIHTDNLPDFDKPADAGSDYLANIDKPSEIETGFVNNVDKAAGVATDDADAAVNALAGTAGVAAASRADVEPVVERPLVAEGGLPSERGGIREPKRSGFPRFLFYTAALAIIAGALGYFFKDEISTAVPALDPPLTSWKQTVDGVVSKAIPPNGSLQISDVGYEVDEANGDPQLRVTATVTNDSTAVKPAPKLAVTVFDAADQVLEETTLMPENLATEIAADASETYFWQLPYPPKELDRVEVDFAK